MVTARLVRRNGNSLRRSMPRAALVPLSWPPHMEPVLDRLQRPMRNLRLSVTDRCNLRCQYCMPEEEYAWLPQKDVLSFEETSRVVDRFLDCGVEKVRITGGEPLLRRDLEVLVRMLADKPRIRELAMTTNGVLLDKAAEPLRRAGLQRLTVSLDTLDPQVFRMLSRRDDHARVLAGIEAARSAGFEGLKLDTVVIRDINDTEVESLLAFARRAGAEIRFIEYMDVGGATRWSMDRVVTRAQLLERVAAAFGAATPVPRTDSAPAERFTLPDGTTFGIISSVTAPFCASCDRSRLTADGMWFRCLYATEGTDLRAPLRAGATDDQLRELLAQGWSQRADRGAEVRAAMERREPLAQHAQLRLAPHLEMHTRGG
ncbi:MAG: Cyclic pyranopterin monophosphate synthase 3 [Planctomycetota bacterium]|jgi:cyclic pyranopterin phosphate synthase